VLAVNHSAARAGVIVCTLLRTLSAPLVLGEPDPARWRIMMARPGHPSARSGRDHAP
jgi:hypothetical protein